MNRKQFQILLVLGVAIGGLGLYLLRSQREAYKTSDSGAPGKVFPSFPLNEIEQVRIKQSGGEINLRKVDDIWRVQERANYPANFNEVSDLLRKFWELKPVREERVGESQFARLELTTPDKGTNSGTLVEFKDKAGKVAQSAVLGKKYVRGSEDASPMGGGGFPVGRYVLAPGAGASKVFLVGETFANLETKPESWLNKDFFKVEKIKSVTVTSTNGASWTLSREKEGGELKLADLKEGEALDQSKAGGPGNALSYPSFSDVASSEIKPEESGLNNPTVANLTTFDDFNYTVKVGNGPAGENRYLTVAVDASLPKERVAGKEEKPEDKDKLDKEFKDKAAKLETKLKTEKTLEKWVYVVPKYTVDPLLKERKDLLAEKKDDKKPAAPAPAEDSAVPGLPPGIPGLTDPK